MACRHSYRLHVCKTDRFACLLSAAAIRGIFSTVLSRLGNRYHLSSFTFMLDNVPVSLIYISGRRSIFSKTAIFFHMCKKDVLRVVSQPLNTSGPKEEVNGGSLRELAISRTGMNLKSSHLRCDENKTELFALIVKSLTENINGAHGVFVTYF